MLFLPYSKQLTCSKFDVPFRIQSDLINSYLHGINAHWQHLNHSHDQHIIDFLPICLGKRGP